MIDYVELHCHSNFSLLDGASHPEDLLSRASALGMDTLALTDHDAVYGAVQFSQAAPSYGIRPILGVELTLNGDHHLTLLVTDSVGWRNLCWLISQARHHAPKGTAALPPDLLDGHTAGLIALSGCRKGAISAALLQQRWDTAYRVAGQYRDLFGPQQFWIELQHHLLPDDDLLTFKLVRLANRLGVGYVATNNVHYAAWERHRLQDVLVCIRHGLTLDEAAHVRRPSSEYYLKSARQMTTLFADYPDAIRNTRCAAEQCTFALRYGLQDLPQFPTPPATTAETYLRTLCEQAVAQRYLAATAAVYERLSHELGVIARSGLANYFLIVWDIVRFAREQGIRCQGRGSAANSLVAYLLAISPIDPLAHDLVFERFLSDERRVTPDIDIDFQADRREEVIQYVYQRYGTAYAAMACTSVTFRARSALREVGKVLGLPISLLDSAAKTLDTRNPKLIAKSAALREFIEQRSETRPWRQLVDLCGQIAGFPRHLSIHNGGMIITGSLLAERVPTEPATMPGRTVIQWDKEALEDAGLIKIDLLGLRMLSAIAETLALVEASTGQRPDLDRLTFDDPAIYALITEADTVGVFQVESRAQAQVLPRLRPATFADLVVSISLIRPGPLQGQMVHPYLRRRLGKEPVTFPHKLLKPALTETLGVILFQEQVIKVARDLAEFSPGQGEQLRRTLGAKGAETKVERFHAAFLEGAQRRGVSRGQAEIVFGKLRAFGSYSFPKSHAAAFAVLVYQSAWLKRYYPAAFYTALLNHQPMGFWSPAVLVNDAKRHGIAVQPVDVNRSQVKCALEADRIRLGLQYIRSLGETQAVRVQEARRGSPFRSLFDFCKRTRLPKSLVENLILAGALDSFGGSRRDLLWELGGMRYLTDELALNFTDTTVTLPPLSMGEQTAAEYDVVGLATGNHVMSLYRQILTDQNCATSVTVKDCAVDQVVRVAGQVIMHQAPPTAKGFHFITLEDEWGMMNVIVSPDVYVKYRPIWRDATLLLVEGRVQRQDGVINVIATRVKPL